MIVVTGASGRVGGQIAAELARRGVPFRAVTRTIGHAPDLGGAEIALAGYDQPDTLVEMQVTAYVHRQTGTPSPGSRRN